MEEEKGELPVTLSACKAGSSQQTAEPSKVDALNVGIKDPLLNYGPGKFLTGFGQLTRKSGKELLRKDLSQGQLSPLCSSTRFPSHKPEPSKFFNSAQSQHEVSTFLSEPLPQSSCLPVQSSRSWSPAFNISETIDEMMKKMYPEGNRKYANKSSRGSVFHDHSRTPRELKHLKKGRSLMPQHQQRPDSGSSFECDRRVSAINSLFLNPSQEMSGEGSMWSGSQNRAFGRSVPHTLSPENSTDALRGPINEKDPKKEDLSNNSDPMILSERLPTQSRVLSADVSSSQETPSTPFGINFHYQFQPPSVYYGLNREDQPLMLQTAEPSKVDALNVGIEDPLLGYRPRGYPTSNRQFSNDDFLKIPFSCVEREIPQTIKRKITAEEMTPIRRTSRAIRIAKLLRLARSKGQVVEPLYDPSHKPEPSKFFNSAQSEHEVSTFQNQPSPQSSWPPVQSSSTWSPAFNSSETRDETFRRSSRKYPNRASSQPLFHDHSRTPREQEELKKGKTESLIHPRQHWPDSFFSLECDRPISAIDTPLSQEMSGEGSMWSGSQNRAFGRSVPHTLSPENSTDALRGPINEKDPKKEDLSNNSDPMILSERLPTQSRVLSADVSSSQETPSTPFGINFHYQFQPPSVYYGLNREDQPLMLQTAEPSKVDALNVGIEDPLLGYRPRGYPTSNRQFSNDDFLKIPFSCVEREIPQTIKRKITAEEMTPIRRTSRAIRSAKLLRQARSKGQVVEPLYDPSHKPEPSKFFNSAQSEHEVSTFQNQPSPQSSWPPVQSSSTWSPAFNSSETRDETFRRSSRKYPNRASSQPLFHDHSRTPREQEELKKGKTESLIHPRQHWPDSFFSLECDRPISAIDTPLSQEMSGEGSMWSGSQNRAFGRSVPHTLSPENSTDALRGPINEKEPKKEDLPNNSDPMILYERSPTQSRVLSADVSLRHEQSDETYADYLRKSFRPMDESYDSIPGRNKLNFACWLPPQLESKPMGYRYRIEEKRLEHSDSDSYASQVSTSTTSSITSPDQFSPASLLNQSLKKQPLVLQSEEQEMSCNLEFERLRSRIPFTNIFPERSKDLEESLGDSDAQVELDAAVTAVTCSVTNTQPEHSQIQTCSSGPAWSKRVYGSFPRSHSFPSLSHMTSAENNTQTRAPSLPELRLEASCEQFTPDISDDEDDETYRFQCSCPGLYQCSVTGLVFHMEREGDVVYRTVPWNMKVLSQHHKQPAGPLFDISCEQQSVCQLHLPHCQIRSTGTLQFMSVAHVNEEGIDFIVPHKITETHVIIKISGFSAFGNVKDEDSPPDPVRALVLLFYRPPENPESSPLLNVLLLPRNVVLRDVLRTRKKLVGDERYIEKSPHCKLHPQQEYTLSTCPEEDVLVDPTQAEFECDNYDNYFPSFQVTLQQPMKHMKLLLRDTISSCSVWERHVCLLSSGVNGSCGPSTLNLPPDKRLWDIRSSFIEGVSAPVLKTLLDKLLEKRVMTDSEQESANEMQNKRDRARSVIDTVRKKGEAASSEMIEALCDIDPFLCEHLGLI